MPTQNKWFWVVLIHSGLMQAGVYVLRPVVSYQALNFGADAATVGFVGALFALAPLILAIPVGRQIDRGLAGTALFLGSLLTVFAGGSLLFATSLWWLVASMPVLGVGHLLGMVGGQTLISQKSKSQSLERNFGLLTFYASIGHALGPLIGGVLTSEVGVQIIVEPAIWFAIGLLTLSSLVSFGIAKPNKLLKLNQLPRHSLNRLFKTPGYPSAIFVAGMVTAVVDVLLVFLPVIGLELGFTTSEIGLLLAVRAAGSLVTRFALGKITNLIGFRKLLVLSSLLSMAGCFSLAFTLNFTAFAFISLILGAALAIGQPMTMAWVSRIAPKDARGMAISVRLTSNRLGQVAIPAMAGLLASAAVLSIFYLLSGILALAALAATRATGQEPDSKGQNE